MKALARLTACLVLTTLAATALASDRSASSHQEPQRRGVAVYGENVVLHGSSTDSRLTTKSTAAADTFALYGASAGAADPDEGRFQSNGFAPDLQGWTTVDLTDQPIHWQVSDFNAANLNGNGVGNLAAWCGRSAAQEPGWLSAPGYGNDWDDALRFRQTVSDPSVGQTVSLDFYFNHDTAPNDLVHVAFDSTHYGWREVFSVSGTNADASGIFAAPGVQYSTTSARDIVYVGNDYGGENDDEVVIELRFTSDGAWSDEDGLWPTGAGAVQIDDITVTTSEGTFFEDFESGDFSGAWTPVKQPFFGDFAMVRPRMTDLDPCASNDSPLMMFVDSGQTVNNADSAAMIPGYPTSTGGQTSFNWSYGIPGGWVVNYDGGLSEYQLQLDNHVWSPEIAWDTDPLVVDASDDQEVAGARFRFDLWQHFPLANGNFWIWSVRSTQDGISWSPWSNRNFVYYGGGVPRWVSNEIDFSDLLVEDPTSVQVALGTLLMCGPFGHHCGNDATPAPAFDNVGVYKYRLQGPTFTTAQLLLANDGFPVSGSIDASTQAARDQLDIPFDMTQDIAYGDDPSLDTGDSIVCNVRAVIPGTEIADLRMVWVLDRNPLFDDVRSLPARAKDVNVVAGPTQWSGEVLHDTTTSSAGEVVEHRFFFDLPDEDFLHPGDVLRYYLRATDDAGNVSTIPGNTAGFDTGEGYDRGWTVRGLPSISDTDGSQPPKLIYNDFGRRGGEDHFLTAMREFGFVEGVDYDTYTTNAPSAAVSNGIGSAGGHGANADQLAGYETILYFVGDLASNIMSDGTDSGSGVDKSDDLGVLTAWHELPGPRSMAYFGDNLFSGMTFETPAGGTYVTTIMGVDLQDADVRDDIDGQTTPLVRAIDPNFATEFVVLGGCPEINQFDRVEPLTGASRGHGFVDASDAIYPLTAASIIHDRLVEGDRKVDVSFPFGFHFLSSAQDNGKSLSTVRSRLLLELFDFFAVPSGQLTPAPPARAQSIAMTVHPNPFNPSTTIEFANLPEGATGSIRVYNLRGERVVTLHRGDFGQQSRFAWDGADANGASVASGVYLVEGRAGDYRRVVKVALVE